MDSDSRTTLETKYLAAEARYQALVQLTVSMTLRDPKEGQTAKLLQLAIERRSALLECNRIFGLMQRLHD